MKRKFLYGMAGLCALSFIGVFFLHQYFILRLFCFVLILWLILLFLSLSGYSEALKTSIHEQDQKTQQEIESKTKELEALTQLLTAKNKELEKRNYELQKHELTALKIMEEMDISNWKLKRQSQVLEDAKTQLEKRSNELSILYDLSNSMGYVSDFENLFLTIFSSITKASRLYAISILLFAENKNYFFTSVPQSREKVMEKIVNDVMNALHPMTNEVINPEDILITSCRVDQKKLVKLADENEPRIATSNFPIIHKGNLKGIFSVAIPSHHSFSDSELKMFQTIVNHIANALNNIQQLIKKETTKMDMMVKSMADGVIMTNMRGEVLIINPSAKRVLGIKKDRLEQNPIEDGARYFQIIDMMKRMAADNRESLTKVIQIQKPRPRFINSDIFLVKSDDGVPLGIVAILKDITKMKELDDMKTDFVSTVSHELRTPLSSIKEAVSLVWEETVGQINETQKKCLRIAKEEVERLTRLINDVLDISKLESGKDELHLRSVEISEVIKKSLDALKPHAEKKDIHITLNIFQEATVIIDEDKIMQVLINLIDNAIKFTPEKGSIS
ncbi:MAG: PAS domain-containing protein, partial [Candidatus Aureabacteria bacterium]|nr:PAS domain-containing protein [Candidatus Auribacterota bacterium]